MYGARPHPGNREHISVKSESDEANVFCDYQINCCQLLFHKSIQIMGFSETLTTRIKHIRIVILCVIMNFMTLGRIAHYISLWLGCC